MFPYQLQELGYTVGHPLGYIASILWRVIKDIKGFNVLHPQGYDSFWFASRKQYAIQTGNIQQKQLMKNIARYRVETIG